MTTKVRRFLCALMALVLCVVPVLSLGEVAEPAPGQLLPARIQSALASGRQVVWTLRVELSDNLQWMLGDAETFAAIQKLLEVTEVRVSAAGTVEDGMIRAAVVIQDTVLADVTLRPQGNIVVMESNLLPDEVFEMATVSFMSAIKGKALSAENEDNLALILDVLTACAEEFAAWFEENAEGIVKEPGASVPATAERDASESSVGILLNVDQGRDLVLHLLDVVAGDTVLHAALARLTGRTAGEIAQALQAEITKLESAAPSDTALLDATVYLDADAVPVGLNAEVPTSLFGVQGATAAYDRQAEKGRHALRAAMDMGASELRFTLESLLDGKDPEAVEHQISFLTEIDNADSDVITEILLSNQSSIRLSGGRETFDNVLEISTEDKPKDGEALSADEMKERNAVLPAVMAARATVSSVTEAGEPDGFTSETVVALELLGMEMGTMRWTLADEAYTAPDTSGKSAVDVEALTGEERAEVFAEMQAGLLKQIFGMLTLLPPEVLLVLQNNMQQ